MPDGQDVTLTVQAGQWVYLGDVNGQAQLFTLDATGRQWLVAADPETGLFTAVLLNYDGSYDPAGGHPVQTNFEPDAGKWTFAWNPDQGTWTTEAPGTVFPAGASGYTSGEWNYVLLAETQPPPPVNPPAAPAGGVTITITPGGTITIVAPPGTKVTITPAPGGGTTIQVGGQPPVAAPPPIGVFPPPPGPGVIPPKIGDGTSNTPIDLDEHSNYFDPGWGLPKFSFTWPDWWW